MSIQRLRPAALGSALRLASLAPAIALVVACSRPAGSSDAKGAAPSSSASAGEKPRYGAVMAEVGRRFELAGRASAAGRFELAQFEVGEIGELFEGDLPRADLPKEGPTTALPALAKTFLDIHVPALERAATARDRAAFATAFEQAATACNGCHATSGHVFIEIPTVPGAVVPRLDPLPAASASR